MAIRYVDYTPNTAKRLPGTVNVCVAEAWIYDKDKKKKMLIYFIVTGPQLNAGVTDVPPSHWSMSNERIFGTLSA